MLPNIHTPCRARNRRSSNLRAFATTAFLMLMVCPGRAAEAGAGIPPLLEQSYNQLLSVRYFALGETEIRYGGPCMISPGEQSLRALAATTNGLPLLRSALTNGTTAAKLYALCGIRHLARDQFDALAAPILNTHSLVGVRAGWITMGMATSTVAAQIQDGFYEDFFPAKTSRAE